MSNPIDRSAAHGQHARRSSQSSSAARPTTSIPTPALPSIESPDRQQPAGTFQQSNQTPKTSKFHQPQSPPTTISDTRSAKAAKVAIPRLKAKPDVAGDGTTRSGGRHRVNHACEPCRHRKTKCSGERPVCRHCQDFKIDCYYADGKRDRAKKYVPFNISQSWTIH